MKRRISGLTLIFLIIFAGIFPVEAATNEGYGEDQTSLGQFVDSFEDSGNVSVTVDVIRNATLEAMELNFSGGGGVPLYENFTEYTQVEPFNRVDVINDTHVAHRAERTEDSYLYYDYGSDYFDNFTHTVIVENDFDISQAVAIVWMVSDTVDDRLGIINANGNALLLWFYSTNGGSTKSLRAEEIDGGVAFADFYMGPSANTKYYLNISKYATDFKVYIYSDALMTVLVDTLALTLQTDHKLEYIFGCDTHNDGVARGTNSDIYNLWIGKMGGSIEGYFSTVDYLSDPLANGSALTALINTSIPANTEIQLQISNDNVTWRDHEGVIGDSEDLLGGFEAIDLRDLNYSSNIYFRGNLSTTDPAVTPLFHQIRLITTIGSGGITVNQTINLLNGTWIDYNLTEIGVTVGILDTGNLASTYFIDGDTYNISEVVGTPGMQISANITGIDDNAISLWITIYGLYDGNLVHDFDIEVWNFTSGAWVEDEHIPDQVAFEWTNSTIYALRIPMDFLESGEMRIRLDHESAGNINHDLFIDYMRVQAFVPTVSPPAGEVFQFFWIVLAIALMLIGIVISKMWFEKGDS